MKAGRTFALIAAVLLAGCAALGPASTREQREESVVYPQDQPRCDGKEQPTESAGGTDAAVLALNRVLASGCPQ